MRLGSRPIITRPSAAIMGSTLLLLFVVTSGCGGRDSTASKSAAEFDRAPDAKTSGEPAHGGHAGGGETAPDEAPAAAGGGMAGMDHSNMPGMKPAAGARTQGGSMAEMDHSNMPGMKPA